MSDRSLVRAIFVTTLAVYLLTSGREPPWGDCNIQYMTAESMLKRGALDIPKAWPDDLPPDEHGKFYSTYPLLTSVAQMPGILLLEAAAAISPPSRGLAKPLTSHLACSLFGALTCVLFFQLCRQRKLAQRTALAATGILVFGTTIWVYAHYSYSEIAQTAMFTGFLLSVLRTDEDPTPGQARWLGLYAGLLFSMKYIYAPGILGGVAFLAWRHRKRALPLIPHAALTGAPFLIASLVYNYLCWGSPLSTGYTPYFATYWGENPLISLWGTFLSPGKSLLLYSPPLILGLVGIPRLVRDHRAACLAILAIAGPVLLVYSRYKLNGDWAWGPRFAVFVVPAFALSFAVVLDHVRRWAVTAFVVLGVCVQLLGISLYWDHFIRIGTEVRQQWLGQPNRKGAIIPVRADGHCDSCFEDIHQMEWLPPFQPILGQWWLVRSLIAGDDAIQAEANAPWHRHTSLAFNITDAYNRARLDWWGMLWIKDFPRYRLVGMILLALMLGASAGGVLMWIRARRAAEPPSPPRDPAPAG